MRQFYIYFKRMKMNRLSLIILFLLTATAGFAQTDKDSLANNMPLVNGRLVYADSISVTGHSRKMLEDTAKKWFAGYFKIYRPDNSSKDKDANASILSQAALMFRMTTTSVALVKYDFYLIFTIRIDCSDGHYRYKIFDIFFTPKSRLFRAAGYYQTSPECLIGLLTKKHMGFEPGIDMGRKKVREYLSNIDSDIRNCIASLNKAMTN